MRIAVAIFALIVCLAVDSPAWGATTKASVAPPANVSSSAAPTAPVYSPDARWVWGMIIVVIGLLLAAAVIGPIYLMNLPEALPVTHSHDEPPGSSHHHGPSGTADFSPPDRLG